MQGSKYSAKEIGQALAMHAQGEKVPMIAKQRGCTPETVHNWIRKFKELSSEEVMDENLQVIHISTDLTIEGMMQIKEDGDAKKHLVALNAIRGTAIDKLQRAQSPIDVDAKVMVIVGKIEQHLHEA